MWVVPEDVDRLCGGGIVGYNVSESFKILLIDINCIVLFDAVLHCLHREFEVNISVQLLSSVINGFIEINQLHCAIDGVQVKKHK